MFVDFVRAKNPDLGNLGFLTKKERLNVLLSRQEQFLVTIGDMECCDQADVTIEPDEDAAEGDEKTWGRNDKKNAFVMKVLTWFRENGRVIDIPLDDLSDEFVALQVEEEAKDDEAGGGGWGDEGDELEEAGKDESGGNETEHEEAGTGGSGQDEAGQKGEQEEKWAKAGGWWEAR